MEFKVPEDINKNKEILMQLVSSIDKIVKNADLKIILKDTSIAVHSVFLKNDSPVFEKMLSIVDNVVLLIIILKMY